MDNELTNDNQSDEWVRYVRWDRFLEMNVGESGSREQPSDESQFDEQTGSKWLALNIADEK